MTSHFPKRSLLLMALLLLASVSHGRPTLCLPKERVVFSCSVSKAKIVSLCLTKGAIDHSLFYRFGKIGKIELVYPSSAEGSLGKFRYAHYFRYQVDRTEISFSNGGNDYSVYDYDDGEETPSSSSGVRVEAKSDLACRNKVQADYADLERLLPCDAGNALASCH